MTTQELKNKIERVLGNNIRCLLPSYWWKNLLHSVADRIDEVEQKIGDDSGITVVDSKEALYDLDLPKGSVASVTNEGIKPSECYQPTDEDMELSKLTPVRNVELLTDQLIPGEEAGAMLIAGTDTYMQIGVGTEIVAAMVIGEQISYFYDINKLNEALASHDFRFVGVLDGSLDIMDRALRFNTSTDVYAKSASWDKLIKEGEVQEAEGLVFVLGFDEKGNILLTDEEKEANKRSYQNYYLNPELKCVLKYYLTSEDGSIDRVFPGVPQADLVGYGHLLSLPPLPGVTFYGVSFGNAPGAVFELFGKYDVCFMQDGSAGMMPHFNMGEIALLYMGGNENTPEWQRRSNKNLYDWWSSNYATPLPVMVVMWVTGGTVIYPAQMMKIKDTGGTHIRFYFWDALTLEVCELNADGTVSKFEQFELFGSEMSDTSVFGVQNNVVKKYIDDAIANVGQGGGGGTSGDITIDTEMSDSSVNAVQNKVVKKYVDDAIANAEIGGGDIDTSDFATKDDLNTKQDIINDLDTIRSGAAKGETAIQKVKTINGESIEGEGNIVIKGGETDTSNLATKEELNNLTNEVIANEEVHAAALNDLNERKADKDEIAAKQDTIADLDTIRNGAALGATALQSVPSEYSPTLDVLKAVYPVGAIYISTVATSPQILFGFGTWERIQDRFLLSAGSSYDAGSTGGEATHKLTQSEIPAHTHTRGTMEIYGALTERPCSSSAEILNSKADGAFKSTMQGDDLQWGVTVQTSGSSTHKNNLHEFIASRNWTGETSSVGGGAAHNNMPPYLAVYMWKRTA